jgi:predicted dehydrogenase
MSPNDATSQNLDRRGFLKTSGATAIVGGGLAVAGTQVATAADNKEKLRIGFIGPGGRGFGAHVRSLCKLHNDGSPIELVALAEVYSVQRDKVADYIHKENGNQPNKYEDYRDMIEKEDLDAVAIGTPDHWHSKQTIDALEAGLHVYCEKPMTKTPEEALDVVDAWKKSGKVMQVGVQSTSLPIWDVAREKIEQGLLGKVLMFQTEYFRNSYWGQWRNYELTQEMTPKSINWDLWLGKEEGLAPDMPFDREVYKQWRRFWPFGAGMYTDLFVHRVTAMLKATGLTYPGRVVGAGGIYLEYDGRDVPDVATVAIDYPEGVQGLVSSTMCNSETKIRQCIRGHFGSFVFGGNSFEFIPERPQVTKNSKLRNERFKADDPGELNVAHFRNWVEAMQAGKPALCHNPPDLGAAAVIAVLLGAKSYREGKAFQFDLQAGVREADSSWASGWEAMSRERAQPKHVPGWKAGEHGSKLDEPPWMSLAGPWVDGQPPEQG